LTDSSRELRIALDMSFLPAETAEKLELPGVFDIPWTSMTYQVRNLVAGAFEALQAITGAARILSVRQIALQRGVELRLDDFRRPMRNVPESGALTLTVVPIVRFFLGVAS